MAGLSKFVAVRDDNGTVHSFGPGSDVPAWAAKKITNPSVWGDGGSSDDGGSTDGPPPKAGKGSGEDKWRAYAGRVGVDVSEAESRDDVITLLELAEVPTE